MLAPPAVLAGAAAALVHATLLRTEPAADTTLETAPSAVRLWFSEAVEAAPDPVAVLDPSGRRVDREAGVNPDDPTELRARVVAGGAGAYTVRWRVLSEDGHVIEGSYTFSARSPALRAAEAGGGDSTAGNASGGGDTAGGDAAVEGPPAGRGLLVLGRGLHLVGLALALGALAMAFVVVPAPTWALRSITGIGTVGAIVLLLAAPVMLVGQAAALQGSLSLDSLHPSILEALRTRWADYWVARAVGSIVLLGVFVLIGRRMLAGRGAMMAGLAGGLLLLAATAANGHAMTTDPVWLSLAVDASHLAAMAAWLGGGACLAVIVLGGSGDVQAREGRAALLARAAPRFSALALVCVLVLIVTGLYQTWAHVASPSLLTTTAYGQALLVKVALFALIAAPALYNRRVLKPRLVALSQLPDADRPGTIGRFGRMLSLEAALGALVLVAAAVLTTLPPAEVGASMGAPATATTPSDSISTIVADRVWTANAGGRAVVLALEPGLVGSNRVRVRAGADADPDAGDAAPRLRAVAPAGSGVAPTTVRLAPVGPTYQALLMLPAAGVWTLEVQIADGTSATFEVDVTR